MRSHGKSGACYAYHISPTCEACRSYERENRARMGATPGTYRYRATHKEGAPGQAQQRNDRRWRRLQGNLADQAKIDRLMGGLP